MFFLPFTDFFTSKLSCSSFFDVSEGGGGSKSGYRAGGGGARDDRGGNRRRHPDNEGQSCWSSTGTAWAVEASLAEHCRGRKLSYFLRLF